jgi:uncharacterized protein (TIGR02246 family)
MTSPNLKEMDRLRKQMERELGALYASLIDSWNKRNAHAYAALFAEDGSIVGFDGSMVDGRDEIERHLSGIFSSHATASYVTKVTEIRWLAVNAALLRAVAGMVPPGQSELHPDRTAVQSLIAVYHQPPWQIALFQNTPAQFHGRPEHRERLNDELREILKRQTR